MSNSLTTNRKLQKTLAFGSLTAVALGTLVSGAAFAEGGTGGTGSDGTGTAVDPSTLGIRSVFFDAIGKNGSTAKAPIQGVGAASTSYLMNLAGVGSVPSNIQTACNIALTNADNRAEAIGEPRNFSRVVGIMWGTHNGTTDASTGVSTDRYVAEINKWAGSGFTGFSDQSTTAVMTTGAGAGQTLTSFVKSLGDAEIAANAPNDTNGRYTSAICIAVNQTEPISNYKLSVETDKDSAVDVGGTTAAVSDTIHASNSGSTIAENVNANVVLTYEPTEGAAKTATKSVSIKNNGDTKSPSFTPADFGWSTWPAGKFWFDVKVAKQGSMEAAVDTPDRDPRETWNVAAEKPHKIIVDPATGKQITDQVLHADQQYNAVISQNSGAGYSKMTLTDVVKTKNVFFGAAGKDDTSKVVVKDKTSGATVKADVSIEETADGRKVSATFATDPTHAYELTVPTFAKATGTAFEIFDNGARCDVLMSGEQKECVPTPEEPNVEKVTFDPNKAWILKDGELVLDPNKSNTVGADTKIFLGGDPIETVVNDAIPAKLIADLNSYTIYDDLSDANVQKYLDFTQIDKAVAASKVFFDGQDVSSEFTISYDATAKRIVAKAKPEFLARTGGLKTDTRVALNVKGLTFITEPNTKGELVKLINKGGAIHNTEKKPTNEPPVFVHSYDPHKTVNASLEQGGDGSDINGLKVLPGQIVDYTIRLDNRTPSELGYAIEKYGMTDTYDPKFTPDKTSLKLVDGRDGSRIPGSMFTVKWDDANHSFSVLFTKAGIAKYTAAELADGWINVHFSGKVASSAEPGEVIENQAQQLVNNSKATTEEVSNTIPNVKPNKEDRDYTDQRDIDGAVTLKGGILNYRLTLDASVKKTEMAYDVHKLGMVDDFDEKAVNIATKDIRIVDQTTGVDRTDQFNIQIKDGKVYIFAKHVDSVSKVTGEEIKGEQPKDLSEYASKAIDPLKDPIINQSLLGTKYWVYLPAHVKIDTDGYVIKNSAEQNFENFIQATPVVSNPLKKLDPSKDVTVEIGGESVDTKEIPLNSTFNYQLNSSNLPEKRADYTTEWAITDHFDATHDQFTGKWAVYAQSDIYNGDTLVFKKGALLADSEGSNPGTLWLADKGATSGDKTPDNLKDLIPFEGSDPLFTATFEDGTFRVEATQAYLDLVNTRLDLPQAWSAYTQMVRVAPGTVDNEFPEHYNGQEMNSNKVQTHTPEHPAIDVEKWDTESGMKDGDRDTKADALLMTGPDTEITFTITNTGDVDLVDVKLTDLTLEGSGHIEDIQYPADFTTLKVGESKEVKGKLVGVKDDGEIHLDKATATGKSIFTGEEVSDNDDWTGKRPAPDTEDDVPPKPTDPNGGEPKNPSPNTPTKSENLAKTGAGILGALFGAGALGFSGFALTRKRKED